MLQDGFLVDRQGRTSITGKEASSYQLYAVESRRWARSGRVWNGARGEATPQPGEMVLEERPTGVVRVIRRPRGEGATATYDFKTLAACGPLAPCTISNSTFSPSFSVLKPSPWSAE